MGHDQERRGGRRLHRRRARRRGHGAPDRGGAKQTIEIRSKALRAGAPVYIVTVTRVNSA